MVILPGEIAVPCTRNPLQRGEKAILRTVFVSLRDRKAVEKRVPLNSLL